MSTQKVAQRAPKSACNFAPSNEANMMGMNDRIKRLRKESFEAQPSLSIERALIETKFYKENEGKYPIPILRALNFYEICKQKTIYIGKDELIVGERGPRPKSVPTFPELTCHSVEDLHILNTRELQRYTISQEDIDTYEREVIPYWKGRTQRERIFNHVPKEWKEAYEVGMFTEFMEQRAPGHTALDGKVYRYGLLDLKDRIQKHIESLDFMNDPEATDKQEELQAMAISCDAAILFANRHADLADEMSMTEKDPKRAAELRRIAEVCRWVPAHAPRDFWEAIQMYWFVHLGTITELNGWDAMNPGHFDQHLAPFYEKGIADGTLTRDQAKELMSCFFIKVNNHTAPPKVGITAKESGTYNDFTNLNIGGVKSDGSDGVSEVSYIMLETIEELHILQPGSAIHISACTPERFLRAGCKVIRQGHGYPSVQRQAAGAAWQTHAWGTDSRIPEMQPVCGPQVAPKSIEGLEIRHIRVCRIREMRHHSRRSVTREHHSQDPGIQVLQGTLFRRRNTRPGRGHRRLQPPDSLLNRDACRPVCSQVPHVKTDINSL